MALLIKDLTAGELTIWLTAIIGFGVQILTQIFAYKKQQAADRAAHQQRVQDRLDRIAEANILLDKQRTEAELLARKTQATARELATKVEQTGRRAEEKQEELKQLIVTNNELTAESKQVAVSAFEEANSINTKLKSLGIERARRDEELLERSRNIEETTTQARAVITEAASLISANRDAICAVCDRLDQVVPVIPEVAQAVKETREKLHQIDTGHRHEHE